MSEAGGGQKDARGSLLRLVFGGMAAQVVGAAARMDVADTIGDGDAEIAELAAKLEIPESTAIRLLRALAGLGLCLEKEPGLFALTDAGSLLRKNIDGSVNAFVRMFTDPVMLGAWPRLENSLRSGSTAFEDVFGAPFFDVLGEDSEKSALFNASMSQGTRAVAAALPARYDFARFSSVLDIGGGDGTLLAAVLREHPALRGAVLDTAEGCAQAANTFADAGVAERAEAVTGNFFEAVPAGADLHVLKSIVHDWDDDRATGILARCRSALPPEGRLLIVEPVLPRVVPRDGPPVPYLSDLNMLVNVGGRERTQADFEDLLRQAGFTPGEIVPLPPQVGFCVIEGVPA